jgi:type I restriction enzyme S subunit
MDWRNVPLWSLFRRIKDVGHPEEEMLSVYREYGVIKKGSRSDNTNQTAENRDIYQLIDEGWLAVNRMKAWQGSVGVSPLRGIISGHYICFRPQHNEDPRFLNWLLRSDVYALEYSRMSRGVRPGQVEIDNDELRGLRVALPPLDEQRRIADFLDSEMGRLDRIIAVRIQQSALGMQRFKQLVDGVVMGDVDALAEIEFGNSHVDWGVGKVARLFDIIPGFAFPSEGFVEVEGGTRLLRGINVTPGRIDWKADTAAWDLESSPIEKRYHLCSEDLVIGMDRPWISGGVRIALVRDVDLPSLLLQRVACIRSRSTSTTRYLRWAFGSSHFQLALESETTGVSVPHISGDQIGEFKYRLPSPGEQVLLAELLENHDDLRGRQADLINRQLAVFAERRKALITAAVTGQIDVTIARDVVGAGGVAR